MLFFGPFILPVVTYFALLLAYNEDFSVKFGCQVSTWHHHVSVELSNLLWCKWMMYPINFANMYCDRPWRMNFPFDFWIVFHLFSSRITARAVDPFAQLFSPTGVQLPGWDFAFYPSVSLLLRSCQGVTSLDCLQPLTIRRMGQHITASSAQTHPIPGIHECKRRSVRVPWSVVLEPL